MLDKDNIKDIAALEPDYMGFIFYPKSPRYVPGKLDPAIPNSLPASIIKTGVFVNESLDNILDYSKQYDLAAIQLHGDESPEFCDHLHDLGFVVIKAFRIDKGFDFKVLDAFNMSCDFFLFDTKTDVYGGSGEKFNWQILEKYDNSLPVFLSGGIAPGDEHLISELKGIHIYALDINSKFELEPGLKDVNKLATFVKNIRKEAPKWDF